jgi:alpha/beta superfamily hydrolase
MLPRSLLLAVAPLCVGSLVALTPAPAPAPRNSPSPRVVASPHAQAPPGPPDGTYVYALSRNGTDQGKTTVVVFRRDEAGALETNETGAAGEARAQIVAAFRYKDLGVDSYVATYQAPFLHNTPLGAGFGTVRYRADGVRLNAAIDGVRGVTNFAQPHLWVFDAPFMTGAMLLPAQRHRSGQSDISPISEAFDEGPSDLVSERLVSTASHFPKTPKTDAALEFIGLGTIWFDRGSYIVHEAHFDRLNFDAHLLSYTRAAQPVVFDPAQSPAPKPRMNGFAVDFASEDGTKLSGVLDLPASGRPRAPAIVFIPPGPSASRNFGGDGSDPMFPYLALTFTQRGYAVLRYDTRGTGKSAGSADETWEQSLADAEAAIAFAETQDEIESAAVYALGYGSGADLALTASGSVDTSFAGVIALAPTVLSYRDCAQRTKAAVAGVFVRTSLARDPRLLAARSHVPLFVLHPGVALCGENRDETTAYDAKLRAVNARATIVVANDLSARFGGLYDADAPLDTEEFFPYRFDPSTAGAIADWLDNPKAAGSNGGIDTTGPSAPRAHAPPPPPPVANPDMNGELPNPHVSASPERAVAPGVVLPPGATPPAGQGVPPPPPTPSGS